MSFLEVAVNLSVQEGCDVRESDDLKVDATKNERLKIRP